MITEDKAWLHYRKSFSKVYDESNYSSNFQSFVMGASHKLLEKIYTAEDYFDNVLEVGAGTGEHLFYVKHKFNSYTLTDLDFKTLKKAKVKLKNFSKVNFERQIANKLSYKADSFDRVVATHVLEHIINPHLAIKEWIRVLKHNGTLSILIPTDPGLAWRLGRNFGPRKQAIQKGFAYDYIMAREHVNSCINLIAILKHYFPDHKESWWPFPLPSVDLNLFYAFNVKVSKF